MSISMFKFETKSENGPRAAVENILKSFSTNYIGITTEKLLLVITTSSNLSVV